MLPSTSAAFLHLPGFINNNSIKGTSNADLPMALLNRNSNPTECQKLGDVAALTTPTSDISSIPRNQTTFYEEPIFVDRFFLSNLITRVRQRLLKTGLAQVMSLLMTTHTSPFTHCPLLVYLFSSPHGQLPNSNSVPLTRPWPF